MKVHVLKNLGDIRYLFLFLGVAFLVFDFNYYLMSTLPGSRNEMCVMGINLTAENIIFSVVLSLLTGIVIAGVFAVFARRAAQRRAAGKVALTSLSGVGVGVGLLTVFCPICALPLFSMFGMSVFFQLFNDFNLVFKILSLVFLAGSLFLLNRQISDECAECVFVPEKREE